MKPLLKIHFWILILYMTQTDYKKPDGSQGVSANDFAMSWSADSTCDDKTASGSNNTVPTGPCSVSRQCQLAVCASYISIHCV